MEDLLNFAKGPLFRFSFAIMILGLIRLFALTIINGLSAKSKAKDKAIPKFYVKKMTLGYIFPIRAFRKKPIYAAISIIFHFGLLLTPILLVDHNLLFDSSIGFSLLGISISKGVADLLTIITVISALLLLTLRLSNEASRFLSRKQDFLWLILLIVPFATGLVCAQIAVNPSTYNFFMLIHILSGCAIFILIPFTKIAHCVLLPLGQWITARAWKFPPEAGEEVEISLGKQGEKL
ncbi:MAG TPA: hypothetical protein PKY56_09070 [Candidatus Kapabacteria bacterium]|nr:hypothetical protein [Candidatus Kapabacteria bacterium]HPO62375.1 hypothetical protein [Candidatus Kapabacteria bacterium]